MDIKNVKRRIRFINLYPPYLGAGIRLREVNPDLTRFVVELKLRWYNRNLYGTHFGGSLYAMCDPFFAIIVYAYLGNEYIVWDKSATVQFKKPGTGTVHAVFEIGKDELERIKMEIEQTGRGTYLFITSVRNETNDVVAEVEKEIYVRKK